MSGLEPGTVTLHGRPVSYVQAGSGPVLLLIHGMAGSVENWQEVIEPLAQRHTVVAPDLPGHGASAPGAGDYSLGALAAGLRDLLVALGHERATLVGHSLGGGIAMQFAYQFPEITERLVLVSSGGLGPEVSPVLRAAALPGAELFIGATAAAGATVGSRLARGLGGRRAPAQRRRRRGRSRLRVARRPRPSGGLPRHPTRVSSAPAGSASTPATGSTSSEGMPVLIVWGERDPIIPVRHAETAHEAIPGSRLEVFENVGHLPQLEAPGRFVTVLERFIAETEPSPFDVERWRGRLRIATEQSQASGWETRGSADDTDIAASR